MMIAAFILLVALSVTLCITMVGGRRAFGWVATAFGLVGLIHATIVIAFDINGDPLDYRFAHSRLLLATVPVSVVLLVIGALALCLHCCRKHGRTNGCS